MWEPDSRFGIRKQQQLLLIHRGVCKVRGGESKEALVGQEVFTLANQHGPLKWDYIILNPS